MFGMGRLAAALILGIVILGARAKAQDTSFMDMNMNMGCMLMAGMHEMQFQSIQSGATEDSCPDLPYPGAAVVTLDRGFQRTARYDGGGPHRQEAPMPTPRPEPRLASDNPRLSAAEDLSHGRYHASQPTSISRANMRSS